MERAVRGPTASAGRRKIEAAALAWLFQRPELIFRIDRLLQENGLAVLTVQEFAYTDHQTLFSLIRRAVEQDEVDHHDFVTEALPETMADLPKEILGTYLSYDIQDQPAIEELLRTIRLLRDADSAEQVEQFRFLQRGGKEKAGIWKPPPGT